MSFVLMTALFLFNAQTFYYCTEDQHSGSFSSFPNSIDTSPNNENQGAQQFNYQRRE
jgi:hypothetical protein